MFILIQYVRNKIEMAGQFGKRGVLYSAVGLIGLAYASIWDRPIKWFAVIIWFLILSLGLYRIWIIKDSQN
jgi:hypothetical protein